MIKDNKLFCDKCNSLLVEKTATSLNASNCTFEYSKADFSQTTCKKCQNITIFESSFTLPFLRLIPPQSTSQTN